MADFVQTGSTGHFTVRVMGNLINNAEATITIQWNDPSAANVDILPGATLAITPWRRISCITISGLLYYPNSACADINGGTFSRFNDNFISLA